MKDVQNCQLINKGQGMLHMPLLLTEVLTRSIYHRRCGAQHFSTSFFFPNFGVVCSDILSIVGNELNFHIGTTGGQLSNSNASTGGLRFGHDIFPDLK